MSVAWLIAAAILPASPLASPATRAADVAQRIGGSPALGDQCIVPADWHPPFTHVYRVRNGGTIVFVATSHTHDPVDDTHRQIRDAFDRYKPTLALVEGAASSKSDTDAYLKFLTDTADRQFASGAITENIFAVKMADERHVTFAGWDFSPDEDYAASAAGGFAITDVIGTHLVRAGVDPFDVRTGTRAVTPEMEYAGRVRATGPFDYAAWYKRSYGERFDRSHGTPCGTGITGKIAAYETYRRNLNLSHLIGSHSGKGEVLFVEAGANHWLALRPFLASIADQLT